MFVYVPHTYVPDTEKAWKRLLGYPGSKVTDGCVPPCECWELNQGLLARTASTLSC